MTVKEFLVNKIVGEYRRSLELQGDTLENILREKLEKKSKAELWATRVDVEVTARILPKKR